MYHHKSGSILRKIEKYDLEKLARLKQESWWGTHTAIFSNTEDQQRWYDNIPSSTLCLIGEYNKEDVGIAIISDINHINRSAKLSGSAYESHRKDEIIKSLSASVIDFCFEMLNLNRIDAEVLETNYVAQKYWIQYLEFAIEGTKRQSVYKCGRYYNSIMLGMLREDWEKQRRVIKYNSSCNNNFDHITANKLISRSKRYLISDYIK